MHADLCTSDCTASWRLLQYLFFFFASYVQVTEERHENSLLKPELEKLREENRVMRELIKKSLRSQGQLLRLENAKLKAEVCMRRHLANSTL